MEEKRRIVEATMVPERSVTEVAQAHGVRANQVFKWRRLYRAGRLEPAGDGAKLLPVRISEVSGTKAANVASGEFPSGTMQIEFRNSRLSISGRVDMPTLQVVLEHLTK